MRARRIVTVLLGICLMAGLTTVVSAPAAHALPTCNTHRFVQNVFKGVPALASTGSLDCVMGQGAVSSGVRALQYTLNECYDENLAEDGIFGSVTRNALIRAQDDAGATPDGVYGPETHRKIRWRLIGFICGRLS
jgi:peptidoglycan hydrolase-like protein with peptidoglycan-binding domain